ncbi:outer membrane protein [Bartonella raoultii]|uniref:Outer membrane beta-barrel protein n=1 Tax=Bartonella raoultii TaxID=1457020 RepID=A0ABS7I436_9HYPH|nr:outer membrane beta-barrel protein [Bartonella raoultii]MBX4335504.1 outer membrane beta-barrel protein [Bartonella raoultii]
MNTKRLISASIFALISASTAQAADVMVPQQMTSSTSSAIVVPPFTWTGFYFGGQVGSFSSKTDMDLVGKDKTLPLNKDLSPKLSGFVSGLYAGSNIDLGDNFILGIDTDLTWYGKKYTKTITIGAANNASNASVDGLIARSGRSVRSASGDSSSSSGGTQSTTTQAPAPETPAASTSTPAASAPAPATPVTSAAPEAAASAPAASAAATPAPAPSAPKSTIETSTQTSSTLSLPTTSASVGSTSEKSTPQLASSASADQASSAKPASGTNGSSYHRSGSSHGAGTSHSHNPHSYSSSNGSSAHSHGAQNPHNSQNNGRNNTNPHSAGTNASHPHVAQNMAGRSAQGTQAVDKNSDGVYGIEEMRKIIQSLGLEKEESVETFSHTFKQNWAGATRVRIGFAADRFMPYLAGGVAYGQFQDTVSVPLKKSDGQAASSKNIADETKTMVGYTLGGGVDFAILDNVIVRAEYRYSDFGKKKFTKEKFEISYKTNDFRVGVAYKF